MYWVEPLVLTRLFTKSRDDMPVARMLFRDHSVTDSHSGPVEFVLFHKSITSQSNDQPRAVRLAALYIALQVHPALDREN